jgi:hypothetical protein
MFAALAAVWSIAGSLGSQRFHRELPTIDRLHTWRWYSYDFYSGFLAKKPSAKAALAVKSILNFLFASLPVP